MRRMNSSVFTSRLFWGGLFTGFLGVMQAQNMVSTEAGIRTVIMEEYTGNKCVNCPQGHKISDKLHQRYLGRYMAINIHQSSLAAPEAGYPDFRTSYADDLAKMANIQGLPQGTVDRTWFKGQPYMALGREKWDAQVDEQMKTVPILNLAAKATVDYKSRELVCEVEGYYLQGSLSAQNALHVALLQNNVIAPQQGASFYMEMVLPDGKYRHNHMLRELITGLKGDTVNTTTKGSWVKKIYHCSIPDSIYGLAFDIGQMDLAVFMTEVNNKTILNGAIVQLQISNAPNALKVQAVRPAQAKDCSPTGAIKAKIYNKSSVRIDALTCVASVNGKEDTLHWRAGAVGTSGEKESYIAAGDSLWCTFSDFDALIGENTEVKLTMMGVNGDPVAASVPVEDLKGECVYKKEVFYGASSKTLKLVMNLDQYGSEVSWELRNGRGQIIEKQAYTSDLDAPGVQTFTHIINLSSDDCYILDIRDAGSDGFHTVYGDGSYQIYDDKEKLLAQGDGKFTDSDYRLLSTGVVSAEKILVNKAVFRVFPNPSRENVSLYFQLQEPQRIGWTVCDLLGRMMHKVAFKDYKEGKYQVEIPSASWPKGMYLLKIEGNGRHTSQSVKIQKF